jgi:hypothetical protein
VEFEPTILVAERGKTILALDRSAFVIGTGLPVNGKKRMLGFGTV